MIESPAGPAGPEQESEARPSIGELAMAGGFVALGIAALIGAFAIHAPTSARGIGPQVAPFVVSGLLVCSGVVVFVQSLRGKHADVEEGEDIDPTARPQIRIVIGLAAVVLVSGLLIPVLGWPLASALLFTASAMLLHARHWWRAALAGLALGLSTQLIFGTGLGLSLPAGVLDWIPGI